MRWAEMYNVRQKEEIQSKCSFGDAPKSRNVFRNQRVCLTTVQVSGKYEERKNKNIIPSPASTR
jgi:hypothetical protein